MRSLLTTRHPIGSVVAQKYLIEGHLAEGGMGYLLRATHLELRKHVVLKFPSLQGLASEPTAARFLREARVAATLRGPHFVQIYDVDRDEHGAPFISMELLEGEDLYARVRRTTLTNDEAIELTRALGEALREAHALGVVHRDIKSKNIFLAKDGIRVLDFGISKVEVGQFDSSEGLTRDHHGIFGTPHYMSPEQFFDPHAVDARADLWSVGIVLYRALSGSYPFYGDGAFAISRSVLDGSYVPIERSVPEIAPALRRVIEACLRVDVEARVASADALLSLLEESSLENTLTDPGERAVGEVVDPRPPRGSLKTWIAMATAVPLLVGAAVFGMGRSEKKIETPLTSETPKDAVESRPESGRIETGLAVGPVGPNAAAAPVGSNAHAVHSEPAASASAIAAVIPPADAKSIPKGGQKRPPTKSPRTADPAASPSSVLVGIPSYR
ncbi:MAG: protein kinase [Polyangiaceae bacterium]|jgi:serine/threonine protein kinase|nr:protein kinase [Polyangiaceae bacterium]